MTPRQAPDQHKCPPNSMATTPIELSGHNPRSEALSPSRGQAGCGLVALLRNRGNPGDGRLARLFCKRRRCPDCGPRRCARYQRRYLELLGAWLEERGPSVHLVQFTIASSAWPSCSRKLRRLLLPYLRIPYRAGEDLIITTNALAMSNGRAVEPVDDLGELLARVFTWTPDSALDRRRPSAAGWETVAEVTTDQGDNITLKSSETAGQSTAGAAPGWELLGFAGLDYAAALRVLAQLDLDQGDVPERELADDWAEARAVRLPVEGSADWTRMVRRLRLRPPTTRATDRQIRQHQRRLRERYGRSVQDRLPGVAA